MSDIRDSLGHPVVLADEQVDKPVVERTMRFEGKVVSLRTDRVDLGNDEVATRDVVEHPGAVGVIALDEHDRVLLVHQYRHPVAAMLWEPPAGLLDVEGEPLLDAVKRELWEEAGYRAQTWHTLVDLYNSPGGSDEMIRLYLARDLTEVDEADRHQGVEEERDMPTAWVPLDEARRAVLAGELTNVSAVAGVLAAAAAKAAGWATLRPADAPWRRSSSKSS